MTIRDRIKGYMLKDEIAGMQETINTIERAWRRGPAVLSEEDIYRSLQETDSWLVDRVLQQRGFQLFESALLEFSEEDRLRAVTESRVMYRRDVNVARAVNFWTDFGFGQTISVIPTDEALADIFSEFWHARRNQSVLGQARLHKNSNTLIKDGEVFYVFFGSSLDDKTTVRRLDTTEISEIIYDPEDRDTPLWYVRRQAGKDDIYYPDWRASPDQLALIKLPTNAKQAKDLAKQVSVGGKMVSVTSIRMMHVMIDEENGRGWPMLIRVFRWARTLENFLSDRSAVAKRVGMWVDQIQHSGGQRATDNIAANLSSTYGASNWGQDTNPAAPAGSVVITNEALELSRRPLTTGSMDAMSDGQMFAGQVSIGMNMPLHQMGWPQAVSNRATAREMVRPVVEQLNRYQRLWIQVFEDMVEIVALNAGEYKDVSAAVSIQAPIDTDIDEVSGAIDAINTAVTGGTVDPAKAMDAINKLVDLTLKFFNLQPMEESDEPEEPEEESALAEMAGLALERVESGEGDAVDALKWLVGEVREGWEG